MAEANIKQVQEFFSKGSLAGSEFDRPLGVKELQALPSEDRAEIKTLVGIELGL